MRAFGTDKPDLRNPLLIADVTDAFRGSEFKVFARLIEGDEQGAGVGDPGAGRRQPRVLRPDEQLGAGRGAARAGLHLLARGRGRRRRTDRQEHRPAAQRSDPCLRPLAPAGGSAARGRRSVLRAQAGGAAAGRCRVLRRRRPRDHGEIRGDRAPAGRGGARAGRQRCYRFAWIVDFPMYEWDEETKSVTFSHNPFSMPQGGLEALETKDPLEILAFQYDIVCNGVELSSGAIRNHRPDIMVKAFALAGYPAGGARAALRRHVPGAALRGAAARRHRARHRPDRDADRGPAQPPRGDGVPAQSAGPGAAARRARRRSTTSS